MKNTLAYTIEGRRVSDENIVRPHAVVSCASCAAEHAITVPRDTHNPEQIGERFRRLGFECNPFKRSSVRCPTCIARGRRVKQALCPPPSTTVIPMTTTRPTLVAPPGGASPAPVSPERRAKVRDLLTGTFDERLGHYLDGYSDPRVAKECDVPVQIVREMRETWLGPIKRVPELEALEAELAALSERIAQHVAAGRLLDEAHGLLRQRLEETRRQLGLAA